MKKDKSIFSKGGTKKISKEDYEKALEPYEQQKELIDSLEGWCDYAVSFLKKSGYEHFVSYFPPSKLVWHPQAINPDENDEATDADDVLRSIYSLIEAIRKGDKNRIANAGIQVGIATSIAHARPQEKFVGTGYNVSLGYLNRGSSVRKEIFQEWLSENYDEIKGIHNMPKLMELDKFKALSEHVKEKTIKGWFKGVYPNHLKSGAPLKDK
ncbi:MAG: hypothetical protein AB1Y26_02900 [Cycloclasticus sp.]